MSHPFSSLSPDQVMTAVESIDIWPAGEPFALNSYENRVLMFRDEDGTNWIVKFYRPDRWSDVAIQEEHDFLQELANQQVPVVAPWRNREGASLHYFKAFRFALFPHCPGQAPELDNPSHLFAMGEVLGRLHQVSAKKTFQHRPHLEMASGILDAQQRVLASSWMNRHQRRAYERVIERVYQHLIKHNVPSSSMIRCHGDCHLGNVLGREEQFTLVDFDDCIMAPAMQDIWMLLPTDDPQGWRSHLSEITEGYEETRSFPNEQMALIEPLRSYRLIRHSAWLVSRWDDPAFPRAFPWLADSGYWDQHIRQLEHQCLQLDNPRWLA
jgi:Ser/Thr protein kinase RdoA (MazF antagonist)